MKMRYAGQSRAGSNFRKKRLPTGWPFTQEPPPQPVERAVPLHDRIVGDSATPVDVHASAGISGNGANDSRAQQVDNTDGAIIRNAGEP